MLGMACLLLGLSWWAGCGQRPGPSVTLYCSQDQPFAEALLAQFTRETGIQVRAVFDSEATKTVGLANRLASEKAHPRADVFWANEELRVRQLAAAGVFGTNQLGPGEPAWRAFGHRTRRLVVASAMAAVERPTSLLELTNARWRGRVSLAVPLFGTTSAHFHALRAHWGRERFETWCRALVANQPFLEDGNSAVVARVARGEAAVGLTDSDDIRVARREGSRVEALEVQADMVAIPNVVALVAPSGPEGPARRLASFLLSPAVQARLVESGALDAGAAAGWGGFDPDWDAVLGGLGPATRWLEETFRR
jgi:iron(III) transport system substrate-binding protein